jgi:hypothetical protein
LPETEEEIKAPLHCPALDGASIDTEEIRRRLLPRVRQRFDEVWSTAFPKPRGPVEEPSGLWSSLSKADADQLDRCAIARLVDSNEAEPTTGWAIPFTVVEEKTTGLRRRFILWTRAANDKAKANKYVARVDLRHASHYHDGVLAESASLRDLKAGFYLVEIPQWARSQFRFRDASGRLP